MFSQISGILLSTGQIQNLTSEVKNTQISFHSNLETILKKKHMMSGV